MVLLMPGLSGLGQSDIVGIDNRYRLAAILSGRAE